jgi:hypothetical protein
MSEVAGWDFEAGKYGGSARVLDAHLTELLDRGVKSNF